MLLLEAFLLYRVGGNWGTALKQSLLVGVTMPHQTLRGPVVGPSQTGDFRAILLRLDHRRAESPMESLRPTESFLFDVLVVGVVLDTPGGGDLGQCYRTAP